MQLAQPGQLAGEYDLRSNPCGQKSTDNPMWLGLTLGLVVAALLGLALMHPAVADDGEHPPKEIGRHLDWCLQAKSNRTKAARLERFWTQWRPATGPPKEAAPSRFLRQCAYRLIGLHLDAGAPEKCRDLLKWLEETDRGVSGKE